MDVFVLMEKSCEDEGDRAVKTRVTRWMCLC